MSRHFGATTLSITALRIMTLGLKKFSIMTISFAAIRITTVSIMTLSVKTWLNGKQHYGAHQNDITTLSVMIA